MRQRKDGSRLEVSVTISPIRDASGAIIGSSNVARDITARKQAEVVLRENAAVFSTLIAQAPMGMYVVDTEFRVRQMNAEALPIFASVQPLIGRDFQEVVEILWGLEVGGQIADIFRHTLATGEAYISPSFTAKRHDLGITQTYEWQTQRVTLPDGVMGVACYFHEVTERARSTEALRTSQERMRLAAEATGVGIWEWNVITNAIQWDAVMFAIYGIPPTPDGLVPYSDWSGAVLPENLAENEAILQDAVRRCGQSTRSFRIRRRHDGECRHIEAVETVRLDATGQAAMVVGTNLDVTERVQDARAIREEATRKDEFLAMLGHELRNPLNAIRHAVQIGHETPEDGEACLWASQVIDSQSQQLSRMVDDLLDVARINHGRIELRPEALDVAAVVERAVVAVQPLLVQRRHTLVREFGTHLHVTGDAARLEQVFVNLLTNAAKYTPEEGRISVRAHREGGEVVVVTTDNGPGIPGDLLPHVFDLFRQADSTLDRARGGLGIGLNVVKSLVEMHRGRVTVESTRAYAGTTVTVRLPLLDEMPTPASAPTFPTPADAPLRSTRVLVVDDHEDAARALAHLLKSRGYEVTRRLRAEATFADALFIAISGYAQDSDRDNCLATGFDAHFSKPLNFPRLMEALRAGADRRPRCAPDQGPVPQGVVESP